VDEVVEELQTEPRWRDAGAVDLRKKVAGIMGRGPGAGAGPGQGFESSGVSRNGRVVYRVV